MTDHTAHHFDNAVAMLDLAATAVDAANALDEQIDPDSVRRAERRDGLRVDARDAISTAHVHATLANAAALRDLTMLLHSAAPALISVLTPVQTVLGDVDETTEPIGVAVPADVAIAADTLDRDRRSQQRTGDGLAYVDADTLATVLRFVRGAA